MHRDEEPYELVSYIGVPLYFVRQTTLIYNFSANEIATTDVADGKKKRGGKEKGSYVIYIYKVLKQVHPDTGNSSKAMDIMNSFVNDIFECTRTRNRGVVRIFQRGVTLCQTIWSWRVHHGIL